MALKGIDKLSFDTVYINGSPVTLGLSKDTRPFLVKHQAFLKTSLPLWLSIACVFMMFLSSIPTLILFILGVFFVAIWQRTYKSHKKKLTALTEEPSYLQILNIRKSIATPNPKELKGTHFFGYEVNSSSEVHLSDSIVRTHIIVFGTTGSGKTENVLSFCLSLLVQGSGFILIDGKGDPLLFFKVFALCAITANLDNLYLMNFLGDEDIYLEDKSLLKSTNSFNFLADSKVYEVDEIISGLLPSGSDDMWQGRAIAGIKSLDRGVYYLKENGYLELDPDSYRDYFDFDKFTALALDERIPAKHRKGMKVLLDSLSYVYPTKENPNPKQANETTTQFQYITMQLTEMFNMLADSYASITNTQHPDISIIDIILRRRVLLVLIPSLSKSDMQVRNLGRIMIALCRNASSKVMSVDLEGDLAQTYSASPANAVSSYAFIFDEFGVYATKGASTLPAQVRSLNVICMFCGQDFEAFKSGDELEAVTIFANCTVKICMKITDETTFNKFNDVVGKDFVLQTEEYYMEEGFFGERKMRQENTLRVVERDILSMADLQNQKAGEETIVIGNKVIRAKSFYANMDLMPRTSLNHFLGIKKPSFYEIKKMQTGIDKLYNEFNERISGDWKAIDEKLNNTMSAFWFGGDFISVIEQIEKRMLSNEVSSENKLAFALLVFNKQLKLVDVSIQKQIRINAGVGVSDLDEFDDEEMLSDIENLVGDSGLRGLLLRKEEHQSINLNDIERDIQEKTSYLDDSLVSGVDLLEELSVDAFVLREKLTNISKIILSNTDADENTLNKVSDLIMVSAKRQTDPAYVEKNKVEKLKSKKSTDSAFELMKEIMGRDV
jgi:intracellular multiplication protein IcmO